MEAKLSQTLHLPLLSANGSYTPSIYLARSTGQLLHVVKKAMLNGNFVENANLRRTTMFYGLVKWVVYRSFIINL